jgi:hypothetical protein
MKGFKTMLFAALLAVFGALQVALPTVQASIRPDWYGWIMLAIAVAVALLRVITSSPVFNGD